MKGPAFGGSFFLYPAADGGFRVRGCYRAAPYREKGYWYGSSDLLFPVKKPGRIATLANGSLASCMMGDDGTANRIDRLVRLVLYGADGPDAAGPCLPDLSGFA